MPVPITRVLVSTSNLHLSLSWVRKPLYGVLEVEKERQQWKGLKETATKIENAAVNIPQTTQACLSLLQ